MVPSIEADRAGCRAAHDRLLAHLDGLTDDEARRPSLLPGWSVGHVLTHLARNAEAHVWMAEGVAAGEVRPMYPGGAAQRSADIDAGAGRPAADLVADVRATAEAVHAAWARLTPEQWAAGAALVRTGRLPADELARTRWREVEIHHADLGLGQRSGARTGGWATGARPGSNARDGETGQVKRFRAVSAGSASSGRQMSRSGR